MTAVEFLVQEINKLTGLNIAMDEPCVIKAKAIEKERIISAHIKGLLSKDITSICNEDIRAEQYYNETFKTNQNDRS